MLVERPHDGIARVTFDRPDRLNALSWPMVDEYLEPDAGRSARTRRCARSSSRAPVAASAPDWISSSATTRSAAPTTSTPSTAARRRSARWPPRCARSRIRSSPPSTGPRPEAASPSPWPRTCGCARPRPASTRRSSASACRAATPASPTRCRASSATACASELMLTGRAVEAEEAARIGLVNRVVPAGELRDAALDARRGHRRQLTVRRVDDQEGAGLQRRRPRPGRRRRAREPHAGARDTHRGHGRGARRIPREAPGELHWA